MKDPTAKITQKSEQPTFSCVKKGCGKPLEERAVIFAILVQELEENIILDPLEE